VNANAEGAWMPRYMRGGMVRICGVKLKIEKLLYSEGYTYG